MLRAAAFLAGCLFAAVPVLARADSVPTAPPPPGYHPDLTTDEAGLWMKSDEAEKAVQTSPLRIMDPTLNGYVKNLVCKLAGPEQCPGIRVYILEVPELNAYSLPNGAIVVWSGLLLRTGNEAQLAMILGHEVTHYLHRHALALFERAMNTSNSMAFLTVITGGLGAIVAVAAMSSVYSHSRDEERDADAGGFQLATANGYDPRQGAEIWRGADAEEKANPRHSHFLLFATHPAPADRLTDLANQADAIVGTRQDWIVNSDAYRKAVEPFRARWLEDEINRGEPEESVVMLERLTSEEPQSGLLQYYLGVAYRKRGAKDDAQHSADAYARAIATGNAPAAVWRDQGMAAMRAGDKTTAEAEFSKYLSAAPSADDKAMVQFYLTQLSGTSS